MAWLLFLCRGSLHAQIYTYDTNGSTFFYQTNNGTIRIWNCASGAGQIIIPSTINGVAVTEIGGGAFQNLGNMTNLVIPDTVVLIGDSAFSGCSGLVTVTIGNQAATIPPQCFYTCNHLSSISIPNSVANIGGNAFGVCASLTNVMIGSGVTNIGSSAFQACYSLPNFTVNPANQAFSSSAGVLFNKSQSKLVQFPPGRSGSYSYSIPTTVTNIGVNAFFWCSGLTNLTITRNVTTIEVPVFNISQNLTTISVDTLNPAFTNVGGLVFNKAATSIVLCPPGKTGVFSVPNSVTNIGAFAFYNSRLTRVIVGRNVSGVGDSALAGPSEIFFLGNAPTVGASPFAGKAIAYYMPGATGWGSTLGNAPAILWNPRASAFGVRNNRFGFTITASTNIVVVVEACTSLVNSAWSAVSTNTLTNTVGGGASYFSDPQLFGMSTRFFRFRSP